jgi:hypothetical protein
MIKGLKIDATFKDQGGTQKKWIWKRWGNWGFVSGVLIAPWIVYDKWIIDWVCGVTWKDRIFGAVRFKKLGG